MIVIFMLFELLTVEQFNEYYAAKVRLDSSPVGILERGHLKKSAG